MNLRYAYLARGMALLIAILVSSAAFAEGGCPPGQYPQQGQGWRTCVPIPGAQSDQAIQPPPPAYVSRWGAVASTSGANAVFGIVSDEADREAAEHAAVSECINRGGENCKVNFVYANQCVAVISIPNHPNLPFTGSTEEDATKRGLDHCGVDGISGCEVYYSGCSRPQRIR